MAVASYTSDLATVKSMQFSDQELVGNQVIHVDADSQSELARFNTYDKYGNPTTDPGRIVKKSKV